MVKALTAILGLGMLMVAQHRGMAGLGLALTLGVSCCMLTALVFLPALLGILSERRRQPAEVPEPRRSAA
jgi:predicted RND superfamily exporter protein